MRILVIEDNKNLGKITKKALKKSFEIDLAENGEKGLNTFYKKRYSAVLIDIRLPDMSGLELCKNLRELHNDIPIIIVSGIHDKCYKIRALNFGADDYVTKPFDIDILEARILAVIRRYHKMSDNIIESQALKLNMTVKQALLNNCPLILRKKEYEILELLMLNKGKVISRTQLLDFIWEKGDEIKSNTVDVHIKALRDKIDKPFQTNLIKTIYGFGYKIDN